MRAIMIIWKRSIACWAVAAGQPVGFILTEPLDDALFIVEVAVHQAWQQQGIGRMLLERVIESARRWATRR
ncbi:Histone acetyltransferase HPA2 [Klebsiella pneumoniae]|uniref:Histone acetyltransferase HPA2 n=1 Tax=Klebsiella pneumoniae TaxID=573 RepID=A0A2X3EZI5_KLEPN|nr:Histone acetyltransferase HPA2 [Klebsiella pneumoniae]